MKKLDAKLFKGNVVPSGKLNYFMGGQTVGTGYKGEADVDKVTCGTDKEKDTTYSAGDSDRDSSWYGNGCGGIEGGGGGALMPIGGISIGSES